MRRIVYSISTFLTGIMAMLTVGITGNIAAGLNVSSKSLGILITAYTLTFAISGPILNTILSKVSDKVVIIISFIIFIFGNLLAFFSNNLSTLTVSRIISAIGAAILLILLTPKDILWLFLLIFALAYNLIHLIVRIKVEHDGTNRKL